VRAHDSGFVSPDDLLETVEVRGRGGTVLMPGVRMLETANDFPPSAPILVITDGACETLTIRREHVYLAPRYGEFKHRVQGPVFWMREENSGADE
jgi:hypothetical protein